jgi:Tol biopolymer transport system component
MVSTTTLACGAPDGGRVAFARLEEPDQDANSDLFIVNADGTGLTQLTTTPNVKEDDPQWSPDGLSIAFTALSIKEIQPDETGPNDEDWTDDLKLLNVVTREQRVIIPDIQLAAFAWSPDGSEIAVVLASSIMAVNVQTGGSRMLATDSAGRDVVWSPDGSMIAYTCTTRDLPGLEFTCVVARDGGPSRLVTGSAGPGPPMDGRLATGRFPQWSTDGRLVISHDGQLYSVDPVTAMPVGRIGSLRMSIAWYDDGLVYGSRCVDPNVTPCQREAILHDYGSGLTYGFARDLGLRWSGDQLRAIFAIGFYGVGIA